MPKAYSYIRFSTPDQLKGDSLRRQTELSENYAKQHALDLDNTLNLRDLGISAYDKSNITKGALGQFLRLVEEGRIERGSYLLVESLDRLSRAQVLDALSVFLGIIRAGITIVTLADGHAYSERSANEQMLLMYSLMVMSRAAEESVTKSKRVRAAWDNKREQAQVKKLTARCPYWMEITPDKTGFKLIPERAAIVKRMFAMAKEGHGNSIIIKRLNEEGVPTFSDRAKGWYDSYVQKILTNPAVHGEFQMCLQREGKLTPVGEPISDYYPALLSKEEWLLVNSIRQQRRDRGGVRKGKSLSNLFSGLLQCGYCGGSMNMGAHTPKSHNVDRTPKRYVACSTARRGLGCFYIQWDYPDLEEKVLTFCRSVDFLEVLGHSNDRATKLEGARRAMLKLEADIEAAETRNTKLVELALAGDQRLQIVAEKISETEVELRRLREEKKEAELAEATLVSQAETPGGQQAAIVELLDKLDTLSGNELYDFRMKLADRIKRVILKIVLSPGGPLITEQKKKELRQQLRQGFSEKEVKKYLAERFLTKPDKNERSLMLLFSNNEWVTVTKDFVQHKFKTVSQEGYLAGETEELDFDLLAAIDQDQSEPQT
jgi:DNA invertase Pin-like site-specific DNA recombinase